MRNSLYPRYPRNPRLSNFPSAWNESGSYVHVKPVTKRLLISMSEIRIRDIRVNPWFLNG